MTKFLFLIEKFLNHFEISKQFQTIFFKQVVKDMFLNKYAVFDFMLLSIINVVASYQVFYPENTDAFI